MAQVDKGLDSGVLAWLDLNGQKIISIVNRTEGKGNDNYC